MIFYKGLRDIDVNILAVERSVYTILPIDKKDIFDSALGLNSAAIHVIRGGVNISSEYHSSKVVEEGSTEEIRFADIKNLILYAKSGGAQLKIDIGYWDPGGLYGAHERKFSGPQKVSLNEYMLYEDPAVGVAKMVNTILKGDEGYSTKTCLFENEETFNPIDSANRLFALTVENSGNDTVYFQMFDKSSGDTVGENEDPLVSVPVFSKSVSIRNGSYFPNGKAFRKGIKICISSDHFKCVPADNPSVKGSLELAE